MQAHSLITGTGLLQSAIIVLAVAMPAHVSAAAPLSDTVSGLTFVTLPAGTFIMGTAEADIALATAEMPQPDISLVRDESPAHSVHFSQPLLLATTEVTQAQWFKHMQTRPGPASHWNHPQWQQLPVVSVSWHDAQDYINKLNQQRGAYQYRLPTEAEWEYAARAGSLQLRPFDSIEMGEYASHTHNSQDEIQAVAQLTPNDWGLYDMLGNVWEWVADGYQSDAYTQAQSRHLQGPVDADKKVRRGGSYHCQPHMIRPGYRAADEPHNAYSVLGFRLVAIPAH